jgi:hypothetical protein
LSIRIVLSLQKKYIKIALKNKVNFILQDETYNRSAVPPKFGKYSFPLSIRRNKRRRARNAAHRGEAY